MRGSPLRCPRLPATRLRPWRNRHRHPLRTQPDRAAASRPCACGAVRPGARRATAGGRFLLRIEDIDPARCRPEFADAILEDLAWLGLDWDGAGAACSRSTWPTTARALDALAARGLLYPCFCTRADIAREIAASAAAPHGPDGPLYPGTCRRLSRRTSARRASPRASRTRCGSTWRRRWRRCRRRSTFQRARRAAAAAATPRASATWCWRARTSPASYHLCVTHDDALQGVTLVTRGEDLLPATDLHRLLQALMGWPAPGYAHHALLTDADGPARSPSATARGARIRGPARQRASSPAEASPARHSAAAARGGHPARTRSPDRDVAQPGARSSAQGLRATQRAACAARPLQAGARARVDFLPPPARAILPRALPDRSPAVPAALRRLSGCGGAPTPRPNPAPSCWCSPRVGVVLMLGGAVWYGAVAQHGARPRPTCPRSSRASDIAPGHAEPRR